MGIVVYFPACTIMVLGQAHQHTHTHTHTHSTQQQFQLDGLGGIVTHTHTQHAKPHVLHCACMNMYFFSKLNGDTAHHLGGFGGVRGTLRPSDLDLDLDRGRPTVYQACLTVGPDPIINGNLMPVDWDRRILSCKHNYGTRTITPTHTHTRTHTHTHTHTHTYSTATVPA